MGRLLGSAVVAFSATVWMRWWFCQATMRMASPEMNDPNSNSLCTVAKETYNAALEACSCVELTAWASLAHFAKPVSQSLMMAAVDHADKAIYGRLYLRLYLVWRFSEDCTAQPPSRSIEGIIQQG